MNNKKTILIYALNRKPWIGGIYYRKNIINVFLSSKKLPDEYRIVLIVNKKFYDVFSCFKNDIEMVICDDDINFVKAGLKGLMCVIKYKVKYVFPITPYSFFKMLNIIPISWIADFQHCYYPEYFSEEEIKKRNKVFAKIAKNNNPLILSSKTCLEDFSKLYNENRPNTYVVHFTSYIQDDLNELNDKYESNVLNKFNVKRNNYALISNQFWKHKNHTVIFSAISKLKRQDNVGNFKFVFTGELSDRRNPSYIDCLKKLIKDDGIENEVIITGFIDRKDQLALMKNSLLIIQPSLFEGWGTVLEDAKALNKIVLLSDIEVHREQKDENCILFDPLNENDLAEKIDKIRSNKHDIVENDDMTQLYSLELEKVFYGK